MKSIMQLSRCVDRWYIYIYTHVSRKLLKVAKCLANCGGARMDGLTRFPLTLCIIWRNHCQGNAHWDNQREKETLLILTSVALKLAPLRDIRMSRLRADLWEDIIRYGVWLGRHICCVACICMCIHRYRYRKRKKERDIEVYIRPAASNVHTHEYTQI